MSDKINMNMFPPAEEFPNRPQIIQNNWPAAEERSQNSLSQKINNDIGPPNIPGTFVCVMPKFPNNWPNKEGTIPNTSKVFDGNAGSHEEPGNQSKLSFGIPNSSTLTLEEVRTQNKSVFGELPTSMNMFPPAEEFPNRPQIIQNNWPAAEQKSQNSMPQVNNNDIGPPNIPGTFVCVMPKFPNNWPNKEGTIPNTSKVFDGNAGSHEEPGNQSKLSFGIPNSSTLTLEEVRTQNKSVFGELPTSMNMFPPAEEFPNRPQIIQNNWPAAEQKSQNSMPQVNNNDIGPPNIPGTFVCVMPKFPNNWPNKEETIPNTSKVFDGNAGSHEKPGNQSKWTFGIPNPPTLTSEEVRTQNNSVFGELPTGKSEWTFGIPDPCTLSSKEPKNKATPVFGEPLEEQDRVNQRTCDKLNYDSEEERVQAENQSEGDANETFCVKVKDKKVPGVEIISTESISESEAPASPSFFNLLKDDWSKQSKRPSMFDHKITRSGPKLISLDNPIPGQLSVESVQKSPACDVGDPYLPVFFKSVPVHSTIVNGIRVADTSDEYSLLHQTFLPAYNDLTAELAAAVCCNDTSFPFYKKALVTQRCIFQCLRLMAGRINEKTTQPAPPVATHNPSSINQAISSSSELPGSSEISQVSTSVSKPVSVTQAPTEISRQPTSVSTSVGCTINLATSQTSSQPNSVSTTNPSFNVPIVQSTASPSTNSFSVSQATSSFSQPSTSFPSNPVAANHANSAFSVQTTAFPSFNSSSIQPTSAFSQKPFSFSTSNTDSGIHSASATAQPRLLTTSGNQNNLAFSYQPNSFPSSNNFTGNQFSSELPHFSFSPPNISFGNPTMFPSFTSNTVPGYQSTSTFGQPFSTPNFGQLPSSINCESQGATMNFSIYFSPPPYNNTPASAAIPQNIQFSIQVPIIVQPPANVFPQQNSSFPRPFPSSNQGQNNMQPAQSSLIFPQQTSTFPTPLPFSNQAQNNAQPAQTSLPFPQQTSTFSRPLPFSNQAQNNAQPAQTSLPFPQQTSTFSIPLPSSNQPLNNVQPAQTSLIFPQQTSTFSMPLPSSNQVQNNVQPAQTPLLFPQRTSIFSRPLPSSNQAQNNVQPAQTSLFFPQQTSTFFRPFPSSNQAQNNVQPAQTSLFFPQQTSTFFRPFPSSNQPLNNVQPAQTSSFFSKPATKNTKRNPFEAFEEPLPPGFRPIGSYTKYQPQVDPQNRERFTSINCMKDYLTKSAEELRYEDYLSNRKGVMENGRPFWKVPVKKPGGVLFGSSYEQKCKNPVTPSGSSRNASLTPFHIIANTWAKFGEEESSGNSGDADATSKISHDDSASTGTASNSQKCNSASSSKAVQDPKYKPASSAVKRPMNDSESTVSADNVPKRNSASTFPLSNGPKSSSALNTPAANGPICLYGVDAPADNVLKNTLRFIVFVSDVVEALCLKCNHTSTLKIGEPMTGSTTTVHNLESSRTLIELHDYCLKCHAALAVVAAECHKCNLALNVHGYSLKSTLPDANGPKCNSASTAPTAIFTMITKCPKCNLKVPFSVCNPLSKTVSTAAAASGQMCNSASTTTAAQGPKDKSATTVPSANNLECNSASTEIGVEMKRSLNALAANGSTCDSVSNAIDVEMKRSLSANGYTRDSVSNLIEVVMKRSLYANGYTCDSVSNVTAVDGPKCNSVSTLQAPNSPKYIPALTATTDSGLTCNTDSSAIETNGLKCNSPSSAKAVYSHKDNSASTVPAANGAIDNSVTTATTNGPHYNSSSTVIVGNCPNDDSASTAPQANLNLNSASTVSTAIGPMFNSASTAPADSAGLTHPSSPTPESLELVVKPTIKEGSGPELGKIAENDDFVLVDVLDVDVTHVGYQS